MSIPEQHAARIAHHVYDNEGDPVPFKVDAVLEIDGREYKLLAISDKDPLTGHQGAIYQDQTSGEMIVAHRGTETSMEGLALAKDGAVDLQMVMARANAQTRFAEALTQQAMEMAKNPRYWPEDVTSEPAVSHTGHSLGGYHAQDRAADHGHGGQSFSAFGAAGIGQAPAGIVEGRPAFVSHIRATDVVANASRHYGDVIHYATPEDVATVTAAVGRPGTEGPLGMFSRALTDVGGRHAITSYADGSVMTAENRHRYLDHQPLFEEHTRAVHESREWLTHAGDRVRYALDSAAVQGAETVDAVKRGLGAAAPLGPAALLTTVPDLAPKMTRPVEPAAPAVPGPFQRTEGEMGAMGRRAGATLVDRAGDAVEAGGQAVGASIASSGRTTGGALGGGLRAGVDGAADAVDAVRERLAASQRAEGEAKQSLYGHAARVADAIGIEGMAEELRGRGLDALTDAENSARRTEAVLGAPTQILRAGGEAAAATVDATTRVAAAGLGVEAARKSAALDGVADGTATTLRMAANAGQEIRYGDTAPNLDMRATAREKIEALYAEHGRPMPSPDQLDRMSAAMVADARGQGMSRVDTVMFSQGKGNGPDYEGNLIAFDRDPYNEFSRHSATSIGRALETPVEQSLDRTRAANERQEQFQFELQQMQARDQAMTESQGMSMRIGARTMDGPSGEGAAAGGDGGGG